MGIISRFFLFLYVLVVLVSVIVFAGVCLQLIPQQVWQFYLNYIITQEETLIILAVMMFLSFCFFGMIFSSNKNPNVIGEIILKEGEQGEVRVEIEAIKRIIERATLSVGGVRESEVKILKSKAELPFSANVTIVLSQGYSAPAVSEAIINNVNKTIAETLEINSVTLEVKVKDITNAIVERKQRVV